MHYTYHNKCNSTVKVFIASNRGFVDYNVYYIRCSTVTQKETISLTLTLHIEKVLKLNSRFFLGGGYENLQKKNQTYYNLLIYIILKLIFKLHVCTDTYVKDTFIN